MKKLVLATLAACAAVAPATAAGAPPRPFGHACTAQNGTRLCPTASDAQRVPSFDGVPLDVDVKLPARGDGPFPAIVMLHGWGGNKRTDDLFPAPEALRAYRTYRRMHGTRVSYQFGDLGHARGSNKRHVDRYLNDQGAAFFDSHLRGRGRKLAHNAVTAFTQTCPVGARAAGPFRAAGWAELHPRTVAMRARFRQTISSSGGNPETAKTYDQFASADACKQVLAERAPGTAVVAGGFAKPFTMLGLPTVRATVRTRGRGGMIAARLWDVHRGSQTLISRGVYRLTDDQRGRITFQLWGNGWRFAHGHTAKLELLGSDPNFLRASNERFSVRISEAVVSLPGR